MDTIIWILIIVTAIIILAATLVTSVNSLHKKFIEKPLEKKKSGIF